MKCFTAKSIETAIQRTQSNTFGIYVGYQQIGTTQGPTKVGRTVNVSAIARGRSQGGADWWFHSFWLLQDRAQTYETERQVKRLLYNYKLVGTQTQQELYSLTPLEAEAMISTILGCSVI